MENLTFDELVEMLKKDGEQADEAIFGAALSKGCVVLEFYAAKLARNYKMDFTKEDIYEVVNSVLDNVIKYYDIRKSPDLKAYMFATAKGKFLNHFRDRISLRREYSFDEMVTDEDGALNGFMFEDEKANPENLELRIMVMEGFRSLNEKCRKALYYRKVLNYSAEEMVDRLGLKTMTPENVRKAVSICLKTLKERVFGEEEWK